MIEGSTIREWYKWHFYRPSILEQILWIFWPTMTMVKYNKYKNLNLLKEIEIEENKTYYIP